MHKSDTGISMKKSEYWVKWSVGGWVIEMFKLQVPRKKLLSPILPHQACKSFIRHSWKPNDVKNYFQHKNLPWRELQVVETPATLGQASKQTIDVKVLRPKGDDADFWVTKYENTFDLPQSAETGITAKQTPHVKVLGSKETVLRPKGSDADLQVIKYYHAYNGY